MIIAIDGPSAAGKGTIAKALAAHYSLPHLDTGLLYRAAAFQFAQSGGEPDMMTDLLAACAFPDALLANPALRGEEIGALASRISRHPRVREELRKRQVDFAHQPSGAVLDGRDISTVIAPGADAKLFVTASISIRAKRRHQEIIARTGSGRMEEAERLAEAECLAETRAAIKKRDERDHIVSPLVCAKDAGLLDTGDLTIDDSVQRAIALVEAQLGGYR